ncbi:acyltransferase family protein [Mucilaginibacter segetis]|nr:acyltransferase [Mucilaginibacter segetis]
MQIHISSQTHVRYKQLDSLRGLAALCVFFSHCFITYNLNGSWIKILMASPLGILINGRAAVMFFFVLSGFVLSLPYIYGERPLKLIEFYIKRVFRIYPAYLAIILIAVLLKTFIYDDNAMFPFSEWIKEFWHWEWNSSYFLETIKTFLLIGPNFNADLIDPVIWSLVVEMKMSIILPFFIIIVSRSNLTFNILFFILVLALIYNHQTGFLGVFYLGILSAKYKEQLSELVRSWSVPFVLFMLAVALFLYNVSYEFFKPYGDRAHPFAYFWRDYLNSIGGTIIIIIAIARKRITSFFDVPVFTFIGNISYSFYLFHVPLLITICSLISAKLGGSRFYIFGSTLLLSVSLSYMSYRYIELPFQNHAKSFIKKIPGISRLHI